MRQFVSVTSELENAVKGIIQRNNAVKLEKSLHDLVSKIPEAAEDLVSSVDGRLGFSENGYFHLLQDFKGSKSITELLLTDWKKCHERVSKDSLDVLFQNALRNENQMLLRALVSGVIENAIPLHSQTCFSVFKYICCKAPLPLTWDFYRQMKKDGITFPDSLLRSFFMRNAERGHADGMKEIMDDLNKDEVYFSKSIYAKSVKLLFESIEGSRFKYDTAVEIYFKLENKFSLGMPLKARMVRILGNMGMCKEMIDLFYTVKPSFDIRFQRLYSVVLSALVKSHSFDEVILEMESNMTKWGVFPDTFIYNQLIAFYSARSKSKEFFRVFRKMQSEGVSPDKATISLAINFFRLVVTRTQLQSERLEALNQALQWKRFADNAGVEMDAFALMSLAELFLLAEDKEGALNFLNEFVKNAIPRNGRWFYCRLFVCETRQEQRQLLLDWISSGCPYDPSNACSLMKYLVDFGFYKEVFQCIQSMEFFSARERVIAITMEKFFERKAVDMAIEVIRTIRTMSAPMTPLIFSIAVEGLANACKLKECLDLISEARSRSMDVDHKAFAAAIKAHGIEGDLDTALSIFKMVKEPTRECFHALLFGFSFSSLPREVQKWTEKMEEAGFPCDEEYYVTLIESLSLNGRIGDGKAVFHSMEESGVEPGTKAYNALIRLLRRHTDDTEMAYVVKEMLEKDISFDADTFSTLIHHYAILGRQKDVRELVEKMRASKFDLTSEVYNALLLAKELEGALSKLEIEESVRLMRSENVRMDRDVYLTMIRCLIKQNELEYALKLYKEFYDNFGNSMPHLLKSLVSKLEKSKKSELISELKKHLDGDQSKLNV